MERNNQQDFENVLQNDDGYVRFGVSYDELNAWLAAGTVTSLGNGIVRAEVGTATNQPRYFKAEFNGDSYVLTAVASPGGERNASLAIGGGLINANSNGLLSGGYTQSAPLMGGVGSLNAAVNNAGQKSIGVNWNKKF